MGDKGFVEVEKKNVEEVLAVEWQLRLLTEGGWKGTGRGKVTVLCTASISGSKVLERANVNQNK